MQTHSYKFTFLVCWCCLLSISIVIMVAMIVQVNNQKNETASSEDAGGVHHSAYLTGSGEKSVDYIHLVWGNDKSPWKRSSSCFCDNTSLSLQNDSVIIKTGGFYHTYAQVTFMNNEAHDGTVTLVANENMPGKTARKLSEAEHGYGTVSMSGVIRLRNGDSVKLNISPEMLPSRDASKTYWGLILLSEQVDK